MKDFVNAVTDADSWLRQANQFVMASEMLTSHLSPGGSGRSEKRHQEIVAALRGSLLLMAVAVESAFKAVIVKRHLLVFENSRVKTQSWGGGRSGHDLIQLASTAGIPLAQEEERTVKHLTRIAIWAGKYRHPLSEAEFRAAREENPHQISLPSDLEAVKALIGRCSAVVATLNAAQQSAQADSPAFSGSAA